jgi:hypothetical protein
MPSPPSKKRAASPADDSITPKRLRGGTPSEKEEQVAASKETGNAPVSQHNASEDFFTEVSNNTSHRQQPLTIEQHYDRSHGSVSPRLPSEMTEDHQLATAVARFRPLPGPVPSDFDVESLPVYRAPVSHKVAGWTVINAPATTPTIAPEEPQAVNEPEVAGVNDPVTVAPTPADQTCQWTGCSKTFSGFNGSTLLWVRSREVYQLV